MPWDGCELFVGQLADDASLTSSDPVAGKDGEESIWGPEWSPAGDLCFASDRSGWWNLERVQDGDRQALCPMEAEFGFPHWVFGERRSASSTTGASCVGTNAWGCNRWRCSIPRPASCSIWTCRTLRCTSRPQLAVEGSTIDVHRRRARPAGPARVAGLLGRRSVEVIRESAEVPVDRGYLSSPRQIEFPTDGDRTAFAHFYPPANADHVAPDGALPPVIVMSHGGPDRRVHARLRPGDAVLDQSWVRGRRRELRRQHRVRTSSIGNG